MFISVELNLIYCLQVSWLIISSIGSGHRICYAVSRRQ